MAKRIAYLGPPGTFSEEAALKYDNKAQLISFSSIPAVAAAVDTGLAEEGVVAIENSLEGSVTDTLDLLIHESKLLIRQELVLPIEHHLLAKPGTECSEVEAIFSHPQALAQCRRFLERCFPKAEIIAALSTTGAVEQMMSSAVPAAASAPTPCRRPRRVRSRRRGRCRRPGCSCRSQRSPVSPERSGARWGWARRWRLPCLPPTHPGS